MKKQYSKPSLYAERFAVSEHIASCLLVATWGSDCPYSDHGLSLFTESCGDVAAEYWSFLTDDTSQWTHENVAQLGLECYNSFMGDFGSFFTS